VFPVELKVRRRQKQQSGGGWGRRMEKHVKVTLRPITMDDALPFMETISRNRAIFRDTIPWLADTEGWLVRSYIAIWDSDQQHKSGLHLLVECNGRVEGVVNLHTINWDRSIAHLGYWLSSDAQGLGIATEAVRWVSAYALENLKLDYLDISTREDNPKSQRVAERAGYSLEPGIIDFEWVADDDDDGNDHGEKASTAENAPMNNNYLNDQKHHHHHQRQDGVPPPGSSGRSSSSSSSSSSSRLSYKKVPLTCYILRNDKQRRKHSLRTARPDNFYSELTDPQSRINIL